MYFNKKQGFTLAEILIAMIILSGAALIVSRIWFGNQQRVIKISDYHKVSQLMEKKMSDLEFEWRKKKFNLIPKEEKGDFEEEEYFSWSVKTQAITLPDPQQIINLFGEGKQGQTILNMIAQTITQHLSETVLEAKLTIHYKRGILKNAYSMTTYIVDHEKPLPISLPNQ